MRVTVGQVGNGLVVLVVVVRGGSMVMMVMTPVAVGVEEVVRREEVVVGRGQRRVDEVGVMGQGRGEVWNSMSHP